MPWLKSDATTNASSYHKGYLCPKGSKCIEGSNPYNGTVSFDNVLQALQLVFVIMSGNTFSDLLYYTTESDYLTAALCEFLDLLVESNAANVSQSLRLVL